MSSDEIAERLHLTRGTVVHHINKLMENGIVITERRKYALKDGSLENLVDDIQAEFEKACEEIKRVAKEIDRFLEL